MPHFGSSVSRVCTLALLLVGGVSAQQPANPTPAAPRLIRFNGSYHRADQSTPAPIVGATFSIYREQTDGSPIWSEIDNIQPDKDGSYTVLLGSARSDGMPVELFAGAEQRWLEVEIDQVKQPRILLSSVPYALKSVDADTLGGLPPSAYLRVTPAISSTSNIVSSVIAPNLSPLASSGTPNTIAMFAADGTDVTNSTLIQNGNTISIGGNTSYGAMTLIGFAPSGDTPGMALYNSGGGSGASVSLDMYNTAANSGIPQAKIKAFDDGNYSDHLTFWTKTPGASNNPVTEKVRITSSGSVGIGTTTPSQKLEVNGNLLVDGTILIGGSTLPPIQASMSTSNFGAGYGALQSVTPGGTSGMSDTALGDNALQLNTTGSRNTASGFDALYANTNGNDNTANGYQALYSNRTGGNDNTASGSGALYSNSTASDNTATGYQALYSNAAGYENTAIGSMALYNNLGNNQNAFQNTAIGYSALYNNTTGISNIAIGSSAGSFVQTGSNNIMIGYVGSATDANDNGVIRIGDPKSSPQPPSQTFIAGISGVNVSGVSVLVSSTGQLGVASSSRRYKEDIQDMGDATAGLMRLRPVTFRYKKPFEDGSKPIQYGLIAEEVAEVYPDLVARSADGQIETVKYQVLDSMLLNEVQRLHAQNLAQLEQNKAQQEKIQSLEGRLARLESLIEKTTTRTALR